MHPLRTVDNSAINKDKENYELATSVNSVGSETVRTILNPMHVADLAVSTHQDLFQYTINSELYDHVSTDGALIEAEATISKKLTPDNAFAILGERLVDPGIPLDMRMTYAKTLSSVTSHYFSDLTHQISHFQSAVVDITENQIAQFRILKDTTTQISDEISSLEKETQAHRMSIDEFNLKLNTQLTDANLRITASQKVIGKVRVNQEMLLNGQEGMTQNINDLNFKMSALLDSYADVDIQGFEKEKKIKQTHDMLIELKQKKTFGENVDQDIIKKTRELKIQKAQVTAEREGFTKALKKTSETIAGIAKISSFFGETELANQIGTIGEAAIITAENGATLMGIGLLASSINPLTPSFRKVVASELNYIKGGIGTKYETNHKIFNRLKENQRIFANIKKLFTAAQDMQLLSTVVTKYSAAAKKLASVVEQRELKIEDDYTKDKQIHLEGELAQAHKESLDNFNEKIPVGITKEHKKRWVGKPWLFYFPPIETYTHDDNLQSYIIKAIKAETQLHDQRKIWLKQFKFSDNHTAAKVNHLSVFKPSVIADHHGVRFIKPKDPLMPGLPDPDPLLPKDHPQQTLLSKLQEAQVLGLGSIELTYDVCAGEKKFILTIGFNLFGSNQYLEIATLYEPRFYNPKEAVWYYWLGGEIVIDKLGPRKDWHVGRKITHQQSSSAFYGFFDTISSHISGFGKWLLGTSPASKAHQDKFPTEQNSVTPQVYPSWDGTIYLAQCLIHYSSFTLPHNVKHNLTNEERSILNLHLTTLNALQKSFEQKKTKRAYAYGVNVDRFSDTENLLKTSMGNVNYMLKSNLKTNAMWSHVEYNIERIQKALPILSNRSIEKALRREEIKQSRIVRRRGGDASDTSLNVHSTNPFGLWYGPANREFVVTANASIQFKTSSDEKSFTHNQLEFNA